MTGGLSADFSTRRGSFTLRLALEVDPGAVAVIVGPNGAGKSTALRTLAGLLRPVTGSIRLGERMLDGELPGDHVDPAERGIGVVFQDYRLFPHLDATDNVAFGLLARGVEQREAHSRARSRLDELGVGELARSRPRELSGGQAQRVALARALVLEPPLLLLDEPLTALDASTRLEVRADLATSLRSFGGATVLVTHDPIDALALADEMIVLENGAVSQRGAPAEVARAPRSSYVADLLGLGMLPLPHGGTLVFDPARVTLHRERPEGDGHPLLIRAFVRGIEQVSQRVRVLLTAADGGARFSAEVTPRTFAVAPMERGDEVWAGLPPEV